MTVPATIDQSATRGRLGALTLLGRSRNRGAGVGDPAIALAEGLAGGQRIFCQNSVDRACRAEKAVCGTLERFIA